jgi:membrane protein DedA with SNARE-associated domain
MDNIGELLGTHGYWLVALGCLLEGETVLALAGLAAHDGHLRLDAVIAIAAVAGFAGDQLFFWIGRTCEAPLRRRFPGLFKHAPRLERLTARWHAWVIVLVRFAYGLRIAGPILLGTTRLPAARFALFNAIGALIWAPLVALAGWFLGAAIENWIGRLQRAEAWLLIAAAFVILPWLLHRSRSRRNAAATSTDERQDA